MKFTLQDLLFGLIAVIVALLVGASLLEPYKYPACLDLLGCVQSNTSDYCECALNLSSDGFSDPSVMIDWSKHLIIVIGAVVIIGLACVWGESKK
jgi:hypothetical protein